MIFQIMKRIYLILSAVAIVVAGLPAFAQKAVKPGKAPITVRNVFPDFPAVKLGDNYKATKALLVKRGLIDAGFRGTPEELVWDGTFGGTNGRATMFFKTETGAWEIAVVLFAMEKQAAIGKRLIKQVEARHGPATEVVDNEYATSHVWRFAKGLALEIRIPKDVNQPVVDIHWVKTLEVSK